MSGRKPKTRDHGAPSRGKYGDRKRGGILTSEVDYSDEERSFLMAVEAWKKRTGNRFPALSELLAILRGLGYRKEPQP